MPNLDRKDPSLDDDYTNGLAVIEDDRADLHEAAADFNPFAGSFETDAEVCPACYGSGEIIHKIIDDETIARVCTFCGGGGLVVLS